MTLVQGVVESLVTQDNSTYKQFPPRPVGSFPRLVQSIDVDALSLLLARDNALGMLASMELDGLLVQGFHGEPNNIIQRYVQYLRAMLHSGTICTGP